MPTGAAHFSGGAAFIKEGFRHWSEGVGIRGLEAYTTGEHDRDGVFTDTDRNLSFHDSGDPGAGRDMVHVHILTDGLQVQRKAGECVKRFLVVLEQLAFSEVLDEALAGGGVGSRGVHGAFVFVVHAANDALSWLFRYCRPLRFAAS